MKSQFKILSNDQQRYVMEYETENKMTIYENGKTIRIIES